MAKGGIKIGALKFTLGLDSLAFEKGANSATRKLKQTETAFQATQRRISGATAAFTGFAAVIGGSAITAAIGRSLEYASALGETAQQLGVTTKTLQEYRYAASQVGLSQQQMDDGLAKLTRSIGEAAGGAKVQASAFQKLGVSIRDANGKLLTTDELLPKLVASFSKIPDPAQRAALQMDLFGRSGQKLDTLLAGGVDQLDNLRNAAHRLGLVLSDKQIQNADDAADKLSAVKQVLEAKLSGFVADNASEILALANALGDLADAGLKALRALKEFGNYVGGKLDVLRGYDILGRPAAGADAQAARSRYLIRGLPDANTKRASVATGTGAAPKVQRGNPFLKAASGSPLLAAGLSFDVESVLAEVDRMGAGVRQRIGGTADQLKADMERRAQESRSLLDELFPEDAERAALMAKFEQLDRDLADKLISPQVYSSARDRLNAQLKTMTAEAADALFGEAGPLIDVDALQDSISRSVDAVSRDFAIPVRQSTLEIVQSFTNMAQGVQYSLDGLTRGLKSGDFLGALTSVLSLIDQVSSLGRSVSGLFGGSKGSPGINNIGATFAGMRALGGPVGMGRTYLVGERGPELFTAPGNGRIVPNGGGGSRVEIVPSAYFDVVVDGRIQRAAPTIAMAGASAGSNDARASIAIQQRYALA